MSIAIDEQKSTMEFHEVANLFPLIQGQEFDELVKDIRENGLQQPIWIYQGKIIDGRNRYRACGQAKVEPRFQEWDEQGSLIAFVISLNVKRRHLTSSQLAALAPKTESLFAEEAAKNMARGGGDKKSESAKSGLPNLVNPIEPVHAAEETAKMLNVSKGYVIDAKRIQEKAPELLEHVLDGTLTIPDAKAIADLPKGSQTVVVQRAVEAKEEAGKRVSSVVQAAIWEQKEGPRLAEVRPVKSDALVALQSSESNEWFTPAIYVEAARELMGAIDVDPASNAQVNQHTVHATHFYDIATNGLGKRWSGRVWLNPPYGRDGSDSNQEIWSHYLLNQYRQGETREAVLLVNANTEAKWFQPLYDYPICLTNHRIRFYNAEATPNQPTQGNAFIYLGPEAKYPDFIRLFSQFGVVVRRVG